MSESEHDKRRERSKREAERLLAPFRKAAERERKEAQRQRRQIALTAAAITVAASQWGRIGDQDAHIEDVLAVADRLAAWIEAPVDTEEQQ